MFIVAAAVPASSGVAQTADRGASPMQLPRPGYEPVVHHLGPAQLRLAVDATALYDSNVYATSRRAQDDGILFVRPSIDVDLARKGASLHAGAYLERREHVSVDRENASLFGLVIDGSSQLSPAQSVDALVRFDRSVQPRTDPEARAPITVSPRKINITSTDLGYAARTGKLSFRIAPGFDRINFLDPDERDRDLRVFRGTARVAWQPAAPVAFFLEGFATRRDADLRRDFSGVDRDVTTYGALIGAQREVNGRLRGSLGLGIFRALPDDPSLRAYTGFAIDGRVTWSPRVRTQVTLSALRGDVATVRAGASGRTDTRLSLAIDQEVRHNFLLSGELSWRRSDFRAADNRQDLVQMRIGADYLATRVISLFAAGIIARRNASLPFDEFSRTMIQVGVRARF